MVFASLSLWAVHISDGILAAPWWLGGFLLAGLLAIIGALRIRDEEIPRIALLTSAFFVASLIHVRVGPTSVHLLLNGLVGVLLGWRAALAIPAGVFLQAVLFGHGGFVTIGVNSCIMTIPAILAGYLFGLLRRVPWRQRRWFQAGLVGFGSIVLVISLVMSVTLLRATWLIMNDPAPLESGEVISRSMTLVESFTLHPATLVVAALISALAIWGEGKLRNAPEFSLGLLVGELTVLATVVLNCLVLLEGGETNWTVPAVIQVVLHLPIAVVEALVLGFTVGLLARVKPEMLGMAVGSSNGQIQEPNSNLQSAICNLQSEKASQPPSQSPAILLGLLVLLALAGPAWAHRLEGEYKILPGQKVRIESWFDLTGESPVSATVQAFRENGELLAEGRLDQKGVFVFSISRAEPVRVVINAGAGHRKVLQIPEKALRETQQVDDPGQKDPTTSRAANPESEPAPADRRTRISVKDVLLGVGFLLALAAFALSWRNAWRLRQLAERNNRSEPGT